MLLSHDELLRLVDAGLMTDTPPERVNASSVDVTFGDTIFVERMLPGSVVSLSRREALGMREVSIKDTPYELKPNEFILASTRQKFNLPLDISAQYKLKSSMARMGIEHLTAAWCDAGWNNSVLTLELKNVTQYHSIAIKAGDPAGQMIFFRHTPVKHRDSYAARGRYNGDKTASGIKP